MTIQVEVTENRVCVGRDEQGEVFKVSLLPVASNQNDLDALALGVANNLAAMIDLNGAAVLAGLTVVGKGSEVNCERARDGTATAIKIRTSYGLPFGVVIQMSDKTEVSQTVLERLAENISITPEVAKPAPSPGAARRPSRSHQP